MISNWLGRLQLLVFLLYPPVLFSRLFALAWYRQALEDWIQPDLVRLARLEAARVLEVGCAGGDFAQVLAAQSLEVFAVDRSLRMLARAQRGPGTVRFSQAVAECLPFPDDYFDLVMAASLLNIVAEPLVVLREMQRVCRPGGMVTVLVPNRAFSLAEAETLARRERLSGFSRAALFAWHRLGRKLDVVQLTGYFCESGFGDVSCRPLLDGMLLAVSGRL